MTVLAFVEASEYRKELARRLAKALLDEIGIDAILDGIDEGELLELLLADLGGILGQAVRDTLEHARTLGLSAVEEAAAAATLKSSTARVLKAGLAVLGERLAALDAAVDAMLASASADAVRAALGAAAVSEALLAPLAASLSSIGAGLVQGVESDLAIEAVAQTTETALAPPLWEWQTREDDKVCDADGIFEASCLPRHGKALLLEEWEGFGLPGNPDSPTICAIYAGPGRSFCRCWLILAGSAASTPEPIQIAEAIKAGKDRALKEAA